MNMKSLLSFCALAALLVACSTSRDIPFTEARNYFFAGERPFSGIVKITSQTAFDLQFGMAAVMGKDGTPTPIDFRKQFVIANLLPETDRQTKLNANSMRQIGPRRLLLNYSLEEGGRLSYTTRPMFLLIVSKKYQDWEIVESVNK